MKRARQKPLRHKAPDEEINSRATQSPQHRDEVDESDDDEDIDPDDERWDSFILDEDDENPQPEYGDFWTDDEL